MALALAMERSCGEVRVMDSSEEISLALAEHIHHLAEAAVKDRGSFSLVISGGDIPKRLGKLTSLPFLKTVDWSKWHVFWAEENVVASKSHPDSIYSQAKEAFFSKVPIPPKHIVPVSHGVTAEAAANSYDVSIRQRVKNRTIPASMSSDCPRFDLVLLTLASGGCMASICFSDDESQWVIVRSSAESRRESVVLNLPVINAAAHVAVVASGLDQARAFAELMGSGSNRDWMVRPKDGKVVWFADSGAASLFFRNHSDTATSAS